MTNTIVTETTITVEQVDTLRAAWDAAVEAERATWATGNMEAVKAASAAERAANAAWQAGEKALVAHWSAEVAADEEARLQAMVEAYETLEYDYADYNNGSLGEPLPYMVTSAGMTYLDHHDHTDSEIGMLAAGGESPYGDGTTGYIQPAPAHPCYTNGECDMDALSRYEDLSYS